MLTGLQYPVQVTRDCRDNSFLKISLQNFHSGSPDDSCFLKSGGSTFLKTAEIKLLLTWSTMDRTESKIF